MVLYDWFLSLSITSSSFFHVVAHINTSFSGPITSWQIDGETMQTVIDFIFLNSKITADGDYSHEIKRHWLLGRKVMTNLNSSLKKRHYFANNGPSSQSYGFSSSHVWMWDLDYKESWVLKNWYFRTVVLEKTLESPLNCKEIHSLQGLMLKLKLQHLATWCKELTHL